MSLKDKVDLAPIVLMMVNENQKCQALRQALKPKFNILFATSCNEGLSLLDQQQTMLDLVLLETNIAGECGYEVYMRLNEIEHVKRIPIMFLGESDSTSEERALNIGAVDFVWPSSTIPAIVRRISNAIVTKRKIDRLSISAKTDALTGAMNRRCMDVVLFEEWKLALTTSNPLSILMVDVDHFKVYNDHFGHSAGDDCLKQVVRALQSGLVRIGDVVYRYGGEEFAVILSNTEIGGALTVGEKLCGNVRNLVRNPNGEPVTVSIGCATASAYGNDSCSPNHLLIRADRQLYIAKAKGRNQVCADF